MAGLVDDKAFEKRYRRNLLIFLIDWMTYGSAMNFVSVSTVLPAFIMSLTDSKIAVGLVTTIAFLGWNFFQLISAVRIETRKYKKPFLLRITPGERIPWLIVAFSTILLAGREPLLALLIFYASYITINVSSGLCTTAWLDIVAKTIPEEKRGFFFATANLISSILGLASGVAVAFYMNFFEYPVNYAMCFLTAFILVAISWLAITFIDEPPSNVVGNPRSIREYFSKIPRIIKNDRNYVSYTVSGIIGSFGGIASSFYTAYAIDRFKAGGLEIGLFTSVLVGTQILTNILWGFIQEKYGHKTVLLAGGVAGVSATLTALLAGSPGHFLLVFALSGASFSSFMVSSFPLLMEMAPEEDRPTYIGLNSALRAPSQAIAPVIGGLIIEKYGYPPAFLASALFSTVSTVILARVRQKPRRSAEASILGKLLKRF
ncbi:MAG: MFS transporter [Thermoproteota archaeon]